MDQKNTLLELQLVATLLSSVAYGVVVTLVFRCLPLLLCNKKSSNSARTRIFFIAYVVYMFAMSTSAILQTMIFITRSLFHGVRSNIPLIQMNEPLALPFVVWGADGLLIWRCLIFYRDTSRYKRMILVTFLSLAYAISLGNGILYFLIPQTSHLFPQITTTAITLGVTTFINFLLTALIIGRLGFYQQAFNGISSSVVNMAYKKIIILLVESCSFIVITALAYMILYARGDRVNLNGSIIPLLLLPHICVISPLMVVLKVSQRRADSGNTSIKFMSVVGMTEHSTLDTRGFSSDSIRPGDGAANVVSTRTPHNDMTKDHVKIATLSPA